jgi:hypothetical protein
MDDLEITQLCAAAMGFETRVDRDRNGHYVMALAPGQHEYFTWQPLLDNTQCFNLIKRFHLNIGQLSVGCKVFAPFIPGRQIYEADDYDLNRAVCKCVAAMQASK